MTRIPSMQVVRASALLLALVLVGPHAAAQQQETARGQPATVPTIVAQSVALFGTPFGPPQLFDRELPTGWPADLILRPAEVLGGGIIGDSAMFRIRTAVFDLGSRANPLEAVRTLLHNGGFLQHTQAPQTGRGGFVATHLSDSPPLYCRGSTTAMIGLADSARAPATVVMHLIDGEAGERTCLPKPSPMEMTHRRLELPTMVPPKGAMLFSSGSSWSDETGHTRSTLRTTMPADSVLAHYTAQLVAGGWRTEGRPAVADGVGVQRFLLRHRDEDWTAALIAMDMGDHHQLVMQYARKQ